MQTDAGATPERIARGREAADSPRRPALRQVQRSTCASTWMRRSVSEAYGSRGALNTSQVFIDPESGKCVVSKHRCRPFPLSKSPENGSRKIRSNPAFQSSRRLIHPQMHGAARQRPGKMDISVASNFCAPPIFARVFIPEEIVVAHALPYQRLEDMSPQYIADAVGGVFRIESLLQ